MFTGPLEKSFDMTSHEELTTPILCFYPFSLLDFVYVNLAKLFTHQRPRALSVQDEHPHTRLSFTQLAIQKYY